MKTFYVTTPIYYVNAKPHIGHAYTTILADVLTRFHKLFGFDTFFLTGVDEHGQKVLDAAAKQNKTPQQHCDETFVHFRDLWTNLNIENNDFIRTTEKRHIDVVQYALKYLYEKGDIYKDTYTGWYSQAVERFWTEKDLIDGKCPESGQEVFQISETNYFFKMSKYQKQLLKHIQDNPDFIVPESRRNEVLGFLKKPLKDLCISRPKSRMSWGVEIPFDSKFVTYVWFDALLNYVSAPGFLSNRPDFDRIWPSSHHLIGKDIITTHAIYWPTMLLALDIPLPKAIITHGWWLTDNTKMSKSLGNVVDPLELKDKYGVDMFRYFLMREMVLGQDSNFSEAAVVNRNNFDLANDLGNLVSRTFKMVKRYFDGKIPAPGQAMEHDSMLRDNVTKLKNRVEQLIRTYKINQAIEEIFIYIRSINKYIALTKPFTIIKTDPARSATILYNCLEAIRISASLLWPVMPSKSSELIKILTGSDKIFQFDELEFGTLATGREIPEKVVLFPRFEFKDKSDKETKQNAANKSDKTGKKDKHFEKKPSSGYIEFSDFQKIKLKIAEIIEAEQVEGSKKLLKLKVKLGDETRTIAAGIKNYYEPKQLIGKKIVIVANLKPRKVFGIESQGMLLAASDNETMALLTPDSSVKSGSDIS